MRAARELVLWALVLLALGCQATRQGSSSGTGATPAAPPAPQAPPAAAAEAASAPAAADTARLLAIGKELFVARCGSCHDQRGEKPLATGAPLNEREVSAEDIVRNVTTRFRNASEEEKRAVVLYMRSFMKKEVK